MTRSESIDPPDCLPIEDLRPTQLYLSAEKLRTVLSWFDFEHPHQSYGRLPVFRHEGDWYLSDGHTRAFVAFLAGVEDLRVELDHAVRVDDDFDLYRTCISWCEGAGVETPADFGGRVASAERFERDWVRRCHRAGDRPAAGTRTRPPEGVVDRENASADDDPRPE